MFMINVILFISALLALCNSASIVDKVNKKCDVTDKACLQSEYSSIIQIVAESGIKELGVPIIDPYVVKNLQVSYFGLLTVLIADGTIKGIKNCKIENFEIDMENKRGKTKWVCDKFVLDGLYKLRPTPSLEALTEGINISGDGKGLLTIDNLILDVDLSIAVEKLDDGELHFKLIPEDSTYTYEAGKVSISLDSFNVGSQDISAVLVNIFNENWKPLLKIIAPPVIEEGFKVFYDLSGKAFKAFAAKDFISGDLSALMQN